MYDKFWWTQAECILRSSMTCHYWISRSVTFRAHHFEFQTDHEYVLRTEYEAGAAYGEDASIVCTAFRICTARLNLVASRLPKSRHISARSSLKKQRFFITHALYNGSSNLGCRLDVGQQRRVWFPDAPAHSLLKFCTHETGRTQPVRSMRY
jgi:hypothetical protein